MVYDMGLGNFPVEKRDFTPEKTAHPINLTDIRMYMELQHIGFEDGLKEYHLHADQKIYERFMQQVQNCLILSKIF